MEIFRAVPRKSFDVDRIHRRYDGRRLPGNVAYFVDNLWELTRPTALPSRRHAVYASPTPELALAAASADVLAQSDYLACRVIFNQVPRRVFQLSVLDARYHRDVRQLQKLVNERLKNAPGLENKLALGPLFLPGVTKEELTLAMQSNATLRAFVDDLSDAVTIWSDAPSLAEGEIMFELDEDIYYTLQPV